MNKSAEGDNDMKLSAWPHYFWKIPVCGLLFFIGLMPGAQLAGLIGLATPAMPAGADQATIAQFTMLASLILALGLAFVIIRFAGGCVFSMGISFT